MKDLITDANFPRTADGRVYHLGICSGEIANRVITVGPPGRAEALGKMFDDQSKIFRLETERGFLTLTGRYKGVPMSVVSIGMGSANCDFFVRECRECLEGDMVIIRLGSCGSLRGLPVGSIAVPRSSVSVNRVYDFHFDRPDWTGDAWEPYHISRPVSADPALHEQLAQSLKAARPDNAIGVVADQCINASADGFYGAQGRQTSFPDHNVEIIPRLVREVEGVATLEMETFHLFHLASVWCPKSADEATLPVKDAAVPSSHIPTQPHIEAQHLNADDVTHEVSQTNPEARIRAASAHMVFAQRNSQDFITPEQVNETELWVGKAVFECLSNYEIGAHLLHGETGSVWQGT